MASAGASNLSKNGSALTLNPRGKNGDDGDRPILPPRGTGTGSGQTSTMNLLDEKDDESLNGWEVLKPG